MSRARRGFATLTVGMAAAAVSLLGDACRRGAPAPEGAEAADAGAGAADAGTGAARPGALASVVDPWTWPRARGATDRERAIEDIGPYEPVEPGRAGSPLCNVNARYWTQLVGLAWDRDVAIDFDREPVDLDGDGRPDTTVTRHVRAKGGVLANPELFGLVRTPEDPRGRAGRISASTGVLGLREALGPDGKPAGEIGMTCFACHGERDPADGRVALGLPGAAFDYGLLLATAAALDDDGPAAELRRARGFPSGRTVRARLLLAGPGRQDLTGEFGLDVTVPGTHAARYAGTARVRQGTKGIFNPVSVPAAWAMGGVDLQNWSGSEVASARWLDRAIALDAGRGGGGGDDAGGGGGGAEATLRALGLPVGDGAIDGSSGDRDARAPARRALLLDLRNLGTLGLQQDSFPGLLWADAIYGRAGLTPAELRAIPPMYAAAAVRRVLDEETATATATTPAREPAAVARGRALFEERLVGVIANRQVLKEAPARYAPSKLAGPLLAPIDEALPAAFSVRCADCHSASPGGAKVALDRAPPPLGRCTHCHRAHEAFAGADDPLTAGRRAMAARGVPAGAAEEVVFCRGCHERHRPFAPVAYSSSLLLPFDAAVDGAAQDDEAHDARAGGIGTEALLAFDVPRPERPPGGFALDVAALAALHETKPVGRARLGAGWVRVPPLVRVRATAPYLHNGSVPTLRALLEPTRRRPTTFSLGAAGFVFDTRLPGNRNIGHEFGTALTPAEKSDLVAFLETL